MNVKTLWTICFFLIFILMIVIAQGFYVPKKSVSGASLDFAQIDSLNLVKPPQKKPDAKDPNIQAKAAILIDEKSFKILYQKDPKLKIPIASTTKIMSGLVVLEDNSHKMQDIVTLTSDMINIEGSDAELRIGEKITVENLLKGLLIVSGNDAANSLASFLGGKEQFIKQMNEKAEYLGLKNTLFKDPAGLDDEGFSTAYDLAVLGSYALRNTTFADIVKTPLASISSVDGKLTHELKSSNRLLKVEEQFYYPFTIGIKTGFTPEAGHCLVSAAEKDGHRLVGVILNTNENTLTASAKESRKLLEWGFSNWSWE